MKRNLLSSLMGSLLFLAACRKDALLLQPEPTVAETCITQTANPAGRSYPSDSVVAFECTTNFCGLMPLSRNNYWVYEDSIFNNGNFVRVQVDTMRFIINWRSVSDGLIWWESNVDVGLPDRMYATDSAIYKIENRLFAPGFVDAKKDYSLFPGDSLRYLASFEDAAAQGRSLRLQTPISTLAGIFDNLVYFEKNARNYRRDQVYFKPGLGVVKYIREQAPMGSPFVRLQQVSTLIAFHVD
ncbi:MAG TPA: hypothetical protein VEB63_09505 [Chitinophagaceae bacterium]|nr:hypothetical protein [Chitinophagaceae bacterium]